MDSHISIYTKAAGKRISSKVTIHLRKRDLEKGAKKIIQKAAYSVMKDQLATFYKNGEFDRKRKRSNQANSSRSSRTNSGRSDISVGSSPDKKRRKLLTETKKSSKNASGDNHSLNLSSVDFPRIQEEEHGVSVEDWLNQCFDEAQQPAEVAELPELPELNLDSQML